MRADLQDRSKAFFQGIRTSDVYYHVVGNSRNSPGKHIFATLPVKSSDRTVHVAKTLRKKEVAFEVEEIETVACNTYASKRILSPRKIGQYMPQLADFERQAAAANLSSHLVKAHETKASARSLF